MKKSTIRITALFIFITVLTTLSSCSFGQSFYYSDSEKYSVGNTEITKEIKDIIIDWTSGNINVVSYEENTIKIEEDTDTTNEKMQLHWYVDGMTLKVKYAESGNFDITSIKKKDLTLSIPKKVSLDSLEINAGSADITCGDIYIEDLTVTTGSGSVTANSITENYDISTGSGATVITAENEADEIKVLSASGAVNIYLSTADVLNIDSASGEINVEAKSISEIGIVSASGAINTVLDATPKKCDIKSTSGKATLTLPGNADFKAEINTASGKFNSDFALKQDEDVYICGEGKSLINIDTVSGNIDILMPAE